MAIAAKLGTGTKYWCCPSPTTGIDVGLSVFGMTRLVLKPDAWRLFRYVRTDYWRFYETMGINALRLEAAANLITLKQLHDAAGADE